MNEPEPGFSETKTMIDIADSLRVEVQELLAENTMLRKRLRVLLKIIKSLQKQKPGAPGK